eukprot:286183-Alexandrium_andersonii.AAC.1
MVAPGLWSFGASGRFAGTLRRCRSAGGAILRACHDSRLPAGRPLGTRRRRGRGRRSAWLGP